MQRPWLFIANRLAIDFVHTGGEGFRARWERWHTAADVAAWAMACPQLRVAADVTAADLAAARALREAIWNAAQHVTRRRPIARSDVRELERAAARPDLVPTLSRNQRAWAPGARGEQLLSTIARDAIDLFGSPLRGRLRECQRHNCALLFVDTSRPGKRTWCSMRRCGNLDKIARYRAKTKELS